MIALCMNIHQSYYLSSFPCSKFTIPYRYEYQSFPLLTLLSLITLIDSTDIPTKDGFIIKEDIT